MHSNRDNSDRAQGGQAMVITHSPCIQTNQLTLDRKSPDHCTLTAPFGIHVKRKSSLVGCSAVHQDPASTLELIGLHRSPHNSLLYIVFMLDFRLVIRAPQIICQSILSCSICWLRWAFSAFVARHQTNNSDEQRYSSGSCELRQQIMLYLDKVAEKVEALAEFCKECRLGVKQ